MRTSFVLVVFGTALMLAQVVWPLRLDRTSWISMGPFVLGLILLVGGVVLGLGRGTPRYRAAMVVGIAGAAVMLYAMTPYSHSPGVSIVRPTAQDVLFMVGVAVISISYALGALAIWTDRSSMALES